MATAGKGLNESNGSLNVGAGAGVKVSSRAVSVKISDTSLDVSTSGVHVKRADNSLEVLSAGMRVRLGDDSLRSVSGGIKAAIPVSEDKDLVGNVTSSDGDKATDTAITLTPAGDGHIAIYVNGVEVVLGNTATTGWCYFGQGDSATARDIIAIQAGDTLRWRGTAAGYELDADDRIDFHYTAVLGAV